MPRHILIIQGHPDPEPRRLCRALAAAYGDAARAAGHPVAELDLAALEIPILRSQADFAQPAPPALVPAQAAIAAAEHIVLIFPLWLGTMPALVKAFLEQVMRPGFAYGEGIAGMPRGLLRGRSARLVVTMGMPALVYRWWFGAYGLKSLETSILRLVGIAPIRTTLFGGIASASTGRRQAWLRRMHLLGEKGA